MIILYKDAKNKGLKFYFTGKLCKHGHVSKRLVCNTTCFECNNIKAKIHRPVDSKRWYNKRYKTHKFEYTARTNLRRARILQATPKWFERKQVEAIYKKAEQLTSTTNILHEVDHIVPLRGKLVCGLHCLSNLQIITKISNRSKSNKELYLTTGSYG